MDNNNQAISNQEEKNLGGVKTSEGKEISKYNAQTHGILRSSLTEYEQGFYSDILGDLKIDYKPQGVIEEILIERIAICYLKLFRVQKAETEFMKSKLKPKVKDFDVSNFMEVDENGYEPTITDVHVERLFYVYSRYETTIENRLFRALHELQRAQSMRLGDNKSLQNLTVDINHIGSFGERGVANE